MTVFLQALKEARIGWLLAVLALWVVLLVGGFLLIKYI